MILFWIAVAAALVLLVGVVALPGFKEAVEEVSNRVEDLIDENPATGAAVFFVFSAVSAMLAFASSAVLVPVATEVWGGVVTFLLLWGGWTTGAVAAYAIGKLARPLLDRVGYEKKLHEYERFVSRRMKFWAVLLFCIAVPSEIPGYIFGAMRYPFFVFVAAVGTAEALYAIGAIVAGESLLEANPLQLFAAGAALIAIAAGAGFALRALRKR